MSAVMVRKLGRGDDLDQACDLLIRFFREEGFATPDEVIRHHTAIMAGLDSTKCAHPAPPARRLPS